MHCGALWELAKGSIIEKDRLSSDPWVCAWCPDACTKTQVLCGEPQWVPVLRLPDPRQSPHSPQPQGAPAGAGVIQSC